MADNFELTIHDEKFNVDTFPTEGNHRKFTVGSIPLSCTISRSGKPECADLHYSVRAPIQVDVPSQEIDTNREFDTALDDDEMPSHARFVIGQWMRQSSET